jgi:ATP/maltotriose-dependent transcriptional regulator MalT
MDQAAEDLYREWLRRQRRRGEARDQLRAGYEIFASPGAGAFAERARIELRATAERAPKRTAQTRDALTAREAHIARLVGQGASNAEIAAMHQLGDRCLPLAEGVHHARHQLPQPARQALPPEPD